MFIDDPSGALSPQAKAQIQNATSAFDVKIVISATDTRATLDAKVSEMVNSANTLAIGVDPVHHFTFTHFGVGTGIPRERYQDVARSGNGEFKQGHWGEGINAIVASAAASRQASAATTTIVMPTQQMTVEHPFPVMPMVGAAIALALGFFLLWRWSRRKTAEVAATLDDFRGEAAQMRSRNIEEQGWHDKMKQNQTAATTTPDLRNSATPSAAPSLASAPRGYASIPPAAAPVHVHRPRYHSPVVAAPPAPSVYIQQSGGNDLLTGVLIGEALNRPVERERVIERHYTPPPARHDTPAPSHSSSSDSSSSSWGDSIGSLFDSGSSGGDFGGGFDGGGGGGDF
jgi:uncharacterized membrane protein YgcG